MAEQKLTKVQQVQVLQQIHGFLSTFNHVPGALAGDWAEVLKGVAAVNNSIAADIKEEEAAGAEGK